jgi:hypothetical protein
MNKKYPWKQAIITGLIAAVFASVSFTLANGLNLHFAWGIRPTTVRGITGLLTLIILGIGIYAGILGIKKSNGGKLTYGQALLAGFTIALTTGIIMALFGWIYCSYLNPGYAAYMISESQKTLLADGKSQAEVSASLPALQKQWTAGAQMVQALVGQTVLGTVIALVMGQFMKSKK